MLALKATCVHTKQVVAEFNLGGLAVVSRQLEFSCESVGST